MNATLTTAIPQIEKQQFRNDSPGWLGVVTIGPKGEDQGISIEAGGTVWLSEAEQILTANAPRRPEDNPFIEQELTFGVDENGETVTRKVTPLTPISENRFVPASARPIPSQLAEGPLGGTEAQRSATADEPEQPVVDAEAIAARERAVVQNPTTSFPNTHAAPPEAPPVPQRAAAAAAAAAPTLGGDTPPAPPVAEDQDGLPPLSEPPAPSAGVEEEHAAVTPPEEHAETGAAVPPSQPPVEGEFAQHEEVGTPAAPEAAEAAPAPYTPPDEA